MGHGATGKERTRARGLAAAPTGRSRQGRAGRLSTGGASFSAGLGLLGVERVPDYLVPGPEVVKATEY